ncbi:hypothetical protein A6V39_03950 [Candidatus Mycoplasma haematobovis]|uniref:Uncharacterized protein n=1 Tax=Candidatus Mycoplasma haematobovis TaxID=432608 RepID=A0A1A9QDG3_9MOLU|nr:hypothetical protein [Candidatus Mycoplasma haematobovis]OAL10041.1 hypothetical protein A6V39_03950 [Candidatus Mycoplasma haematobovis]
MASNIAIKLGVGIASAGAIGGAGYGIYSYNNTTDTVQSYLEKNNFVVIKQSEQDLWNKSYEAYKFEKTSDLTITPDNSEGIKAWCNTALNKTIKSKTEIDYTGATKLCVRFETIKDKLSKELEQTVTKLNGKLDLFTTSIQEEIKKINAEEGQNKVGTQIQKWCAENSKRRNSTENKPYLDDIRKNCLTA